jgi:hypothetical protein
MSRGKKSLSLVGQDSGVSRSGWEPRLLLPFNETRVGTDRVFFLYTILCTTNLANLEAAGTHYFWKYSTTLYGTVLLPPSGCTLHHINKVDIRYFKFAHAGRWLILFKHHFTLLKRFVFLYMWLLKFGHYISHLSINTKASCITYILFSYVTFYMPLIRL